MANKRNLNCKKGMESKTTHFCLQTRGLIRVWEEGEEEEEEGGGAKQSKGMEVKSFCMDSSMILVQELLGYGLLGFHLDINLVLFFRVLLGIYPNSRIKGSLVENL